MSSLLLPTNLAGELYVRALSNAYRRGTRIYDPDYAHIQDIQAYEKMRRDPGIAHAMNFRRHTVAGREWLVTPASDSPEDVMSAKIIRQILKEIRRFAAARFNLSDAVFRGSTFAKIEGGRTFKDYGDGKDRKWWVPKRLRDIDRWRFRQAPNMDEALSTTWEFWNVGKSTWTPLTRMQRRTLIAHTYVDDEASLGYGRGLIEALYHFYWFKTIVLREGIQGVEKWAQGWVVAEIDDLRMGSTDKTNAEEVEKWMDALDAMRSRHSFAHGKNDKINIHETSGRGHQIVLEMLTYLDQAMDRLILAGVLPTGGGQQFGSMARAKEEASSTESLLQYDRDLLSEDITRDLITTIWVLNRSNFVSLGLGRAKMPTFTIQQQKRGDPKTAIEVIKEALGAGVPLLVDEVYSKLEYTPPTPKDLVFAPSKAPSPSVGGLDGAMAGTPTPDGGSLDSLGRKRDPFGRFAPGDGDGNSDDGSNANAEDS